MNNPIYKDLPPVERKRDGSLYRMTPAQHKQAKSLLRRECCSYDDGNCLEQDDGDAHNDESTPHIHERHVFQCRNKYGEMCPQQEKALEELGIPLPNPDKPKGRNNNRKMTFDAMCRRMFIGICKKH